MAVTCSQLCDSDLFPTVCMLVRSLTLADESTRTLRLTQSLYDNYTSLLTTSSQLVKALEKADWYDRLLILSAFILFLLVVGWVIKRRVLDKVVGGVGWWVGGSWKLVKMGVGRGPRALQAGKGGDGAGVGRAIKSGASIVSKVGDGAAALSGVGSLPSLEVLPPEPPVPPRDEL